MLLDGVTLVISVLSVALLLLTAAASAYAAWRHHDTHRLNISVVTGTVAISATLGGSGVRQGLGVILTLAIPYCLLRLVRHFRRVPTWLQTGAIAAIGIGSVGYFVGPQPSTGYLIAAYFVALFVYAGVKFTREAGNTSGVTARRLVFAAAGTWMFAIAFTLSGMSHLVDFIRDFTGQAKDYLYTGIAICYFLAFNTPRSLKMRWQGVEQSKYLSHTADRDPEERGARAADDLNRAAARSVGHSVTLVALRATPSAADLVVCASSDPSFMGLTITPAHRLMDRICLPGAVATSAPPAECEPELARRLAPLGTQVLVAPVATTTQTWGVVLVVQRHGSLFPDDDLRLIGQLGRYAATALDHAHLVIDVRERERRAADRRLRETESRMSLMLDSIKDYAMFVLDQQGKVVTWHIGAEHVFGYTGAEMQDEPAAPLYGMTQADFAALLDESRRFGHAEREAPCARRDGSKFVGAATIRPLESDGNELVGFVAVTHDVTVRRDLEERLRQSQKMEAIGRLAGGIAHDFNNLLLAISGNADLLALEVTAEPGRMQLVDEIRKASERAAGLTRQLLAFSRQQMLQSVPINLSRLVADLVPMLRRVIPAQIDISDETTAEVSPVLGDRSQFEQIVLNLALNARDAMPMGGRLTFRTANVWLDGSSTGAALPSGAYAMLDVTDTGIGMDEATQARIFEPFFTTKEVGRGTGLGLATVYGIVQQMSGTIRVESVLEKGTTFKLYFPEARDRKAAVEPPPPPAKPATPRGHETILLVEDEESVRTFLKRTLERQGYRVIAADSPAAALVMAQAHIEPLHLVISDVVLPGGTGPEMVKTLEQIRPGVPALFISGYADGVIAQQGAFAKASHFLQKPFSAGDLLLRVRQILEPS